MRFRATIQGTGKTAAGIRVPDDVVAALGPSRKPQVVMTIDGHSYRGSVASMGGEFWIGVTNEFRSTAGIAAGDEVDVDLVLDTQPREVTVPADLAAALDADPEARTFFERLSYSNKRRIVEPVADAKSPETRQRRIEKSVAKLHDGTI
ncbi:MAG: YdeI/OmpD-associated family protein [Chloroflexota bacterium]|jgi:hypothetical protein